MSRALAVFAGATRRLRGRLPQQQAVVKQLVALVQPRSRAESRHARLSTFPALEQVPNRAGAP